VTIINGLDIDLKGRMVKKKGSGITRSLKGRDSRFGRRGTQGEEELIFEGIEGKRETLLYHSTDCSMKRF